MKLTRSAMAAVLAAWVLAAGAPTMAQDRSAPPPAADSARAPIEPPQPAVVYVTYNFYHSDVIVSRAMLLAQPDAISRAVAGATEAPWLLVGWGDDAFGRHSKNKLLRMLKGLEALLLPNGRSAMRIVGLQDPATPVEDYSAVREIPMTAEELAGVRQRLERSLSRADDGGPISTHIVAMSGEHFFESPETYSLFHQCNHWIGEILQAGGAHTTPAFDILPLLLRLDLRLHGHAGRLIAHRPVTPLRLAAAQSPVSQ